MGTVTRILITGAAGFIGRRTVDAARAAGLHVRAVVRGSVPAEWDSDPDIEVLRCDLAKPDAVAILRPGLNGVDAVIHAAAHLGGDALAHTTDTQAATQTLLAALRGSNVRRLVLVSSIAIYDTMTLAPNAILTEACPLESETTARDPYVAGKLAQERLCRAAATREGTDLWLMRPGAVYGPDRLWNGHLGPGLGPVLLLSGQAGQVPLCHVGHCSWALVAAAQKDAKDLQTLNILDDDLPDRDRFVAAMQQSGWPRYVLPLPWQILLGGAKILRSVQTHLPGLLREPVLRARIMPLRYCNRALRTALGPHKGDSFDVLMARAIAEGRT